MDNPPTSEAGLFFPSVEAPVASTSALSPPSTPPRHLAQARPVSPRGPLVPQETLAVRRFKAAARLSPTLGSRPRTRSADELGCETMGGSSEGAATAGLGLNGDGTVAQQDGLQMSIRPARYDAALQHAVPHTAPPVASSSLTSTSPFGSSFKFPSTSPRPPSSLSSDSPTIPAPESPLRLSLAALSSSFPDLGVLVESSSESKGKERREEEKPPAREVPGVLLRAASEDVVPGVNEREAVVTAKADPAALGAEPPRKSPARSSSKPLPSPPVRSPSYRPALPSPLSTSHTSATSADGLGPAMRRPVEEFPFPPSPSTPHFASSSGTPRAVSPSPSTPVGPNFQHDGDVPPSSSHAAIPRHLQHVSPPRASERVRSHSGDFHSSPPRAPTTQGHWRSTSSSVTSSPHHVYASPEPAPLTPPESAGTGRHLTSAADLAWNDVLGPIGALSFSGIDFSLGESRDGSGKSSIRQVDDLMALEDETPAPVRMTPGTTGVGAVGAATSNTGTPNGSNERMGNEALMLGSGGGHFGPSTRERLATLIERHLPKVPLAKEDEVIHIVEYGALNSRSASLVPPIISQLATRHAALCPTTSSASSSSSQADDTDSSLSFQVTHADKVGSDFRALSQMLESNSDSSYLNPAWLAAQDLENKVFSAFASRPFASKVLPRSSVSFGFSAMALHWLSTDRKYHMPPSTLAHGELMAFLSSRATEFKPGGLLAMAYIARSESSPSPTTPAASAALQHVLQRGASTNSSSSPHANGGGSFSNPGTPGVPVEAMRPTLRERAISSPAVPLAKKRDIWDLLSGILGKAIQRLVSTNLLKPAVARLLLALPIHPRTPRQTQAVLRAMQHSWTVEEEEIIVLSHPAWRGLEHKTVSPASYSDHTMQLLKIFYESTMRLILRDALESRAACEWILECLWTVAKEKVDEEGPQPLELEVQIVALRRKGPETSTATA